MRVPMRVPSFMDMTLSLKPTGRGLLKRACACRKISGLAGWRWAHRSLLSVSIALRMIGVPHTIDPGRWLRLGSGTGPKLNSDQR
jgi:hypothetical protein